MTAVSPGASLVSETLPPLLSETPIACSPSVRAARGAPLMGPVHPLRRPNPARRAPAARGGARSGGAPAARAPDRPAGAGRLGRASTWATWPATRCGRLARARRPGGGRRRARCPGRHRLRPAPQHGPAGERPRRDPAVAVRPARAADAAAGLGGGRGAPAADRRKYRDELLWQEYARHLYARLGRATAEPLRFAPPRRPRRAGRASPGRSGWPAPPRRPRAARGRLAGQPGAHVADARSGRCGPARDWREGAQEMYRHLLDGSPAANRLGWQWTVGTGTGKVYGFSRWQVEKRAPGLCRRLRAARGLPGAGLAAGADAALGSSLPAAWPAAPPTPVPSGCRSPAPRRRCG